LALAVTFDTTVMHVAIEVHPAGDQGELHDWPADDESQLPCDIPDDAPSALTTAPRDGE
jgi:hypothetical protein